MNILLVKLSSLGDVLHNLPALWDIRTHYPHARIDWVVEEAYLDLLRPLQTQGKLQGIDHIIPCALRRWKKNNLQWKTLKKNIAQFTQFRHHLQSTEYDIIIDTQGLIKSAVIARLAKRTPNGIIVGLANRTEESGYEPLVKLFYTRNIIVPTDIHAIDRSRLLAAAACGYPKPDRAQMPPKFYPDFYIKSLTQTRFSKPYALCFHATARDAKRWPNESWVALGKVLADRGCTVVFPWGNAREKEISLMLAAAVPGAVVPEAFSIMEAFGLIAQATITLGVDTGLTHLSAMLSTPTIELYCDSPRRKTEGYWSKNIMNLGDRGTPPTFRDVLAAVDRLVSPGDDRII